MANHDNSRIRATVNGDETTTGVERRKFLANALKSTGVIVAAAGAMTGCGSNGSREKPIDPSDVGGQFLHGVASGDPLADAVIIWTRVTPEEIGNAVSEVNVHWQVAEDAGFNTVIAEGADAAVSERDYTLKIDVKGLEAGREYFYRFSSSTHNSIVGVAKTLPEGTVDAIKLAVVSCSNYPAGYFHVYEEIAKQGSLDAIIHLGDYLYEYSRGGYASEAAAAMGREVLPEGELISLADYRMRYSQYRSDQQLQAAHASAPFICVWDDHEIANDTWREGAENHNEADGDFRLRLQAALQAYAEWMPIRPPVDSDLASLQRNFQFGNLVNLIMLDTRLIGRDKQLNLASYFSENGFDESGYAADLYDPSRTLLGADQLNWLNAQLMSGATWQVLGQQVLMGKMELPAAVVTQQLSLSDFAMLAELATVAQQDPMALSAEQIQYVQDNMHLLTLGKLPYNLDAWDGYPLEREAILQTISATESNLVVLAGDTHNAWANQLSLGDQPIGVELATASVSSPGLEQYLALDTEQKVMQTEAGLVALIEGLQYTNLSDRGYLILEITEQKATANFHFVNNIQQAAYSLLDQRSMRLEVLAGNSTFS